MRPMIARVLPVLCALAVFLPDSAAMAWGATGHRLVGVLGAEALPADLPAFLHRPDAIEAVGELAREPDRSKASGKIHDSMRDPAHFINLDDGGRVSGGPAIGALPPTRAEFEIALRAVNTDSTRSGYLPYAIVDGWQQLTKDFAYWRVLTAAIPRETDAVHRAWMQRDLVRREAIILHDLGVWAHFVGDASQPMHVSIHYNGWGNFPNPNGYTQEKVHVPFEGAFVRTYVDVYAVRAAMSPSRICHAPIDICTAQYLSATLAAVEPFYVLKKAGGFVNGDPRGRVFATERLAAAAGALRDFTVAAWISSARFSVGYPAVNLDQVVNGVDPYEALHGED